MNDEEKFIGKEAILKIEQVILKLEEAYRTEYDTIIENLRFIIADIKFEIKAEQYVCNYCLESVIKLPDVFGCKECIKKHK